MWLTIVSTWRRISVIECCAEVTVLSQSLRKRDDGLRLGIAAYYAELPSQVHGARRSRFAQYRRARGQ